MVIRISSLAIDIFCPLSIHDRSRLASDWHSSTRERPDFAGNDLMGRIGDEETGVSCDTLDGVSRRDFRDDRLVERSSRGLGKGSLFRSYLQPNRYGVGPLGQNPSTSKLICMFSNR